MSFTFIAASVFALQAASPAAATHAAEVQKAGAEIEVVEKKPEKITDKNHPDYLRCKTQSVIGSRAKRTKTCMTNKEWALASRRGNENTRDIVGANQPGFLGEGN